MRPPSLFRSFWIAGFEGACHINSAGVRLDMIAAVQHDRQAAEDYALLRTVGIRTARDGLRWHLIDKGGHYDFSSWAPMVRAARQHRVQVIWALCHYGWPRDIDLFAPAFVDRFARFCRAIAGFLTDQGEETPIFSPMNEISFLSWAVGHMGFMFPHAPGRAEEVKCQLVRAAIAGMEAIWAVNPRARFLHADPLIHVVEPRGRLDLKVAAAAQRAAQFEGWDMLAGRLHPELGGHPRFLDIVGVNYYHANQWEHPDVRMRWEDTPRDERWVPLHRLLAEVAERYRRPLVVGETSHFGVGRAPWLREIAQEVYQARRNGVPLEGVCLYPILDRHDWEDPNHWHHSGLWDLIPDGQGRLHRCLHEEYAAELQRAQQLLTEIGCR
ncbi:MAG: beta-glucosidase [Planctomycetes bacterium]|nr:beta-glucosidase [Planctomycetota bacterium]